MSKFHYSDSALQSVPSATVTCPMRAVPVRVGSPEKWAVEPAPAETTRPGNELGLPKNPANAPLPMVHVAVVPSAKLPLVR